jgi:hypothetical protein
MHVLKCFLSTVCRILKSQSNKRVPVAVGYVVTLFQIVTALSVELFYSLAINEAMETIASTVYMRFKKRVSLITFKASCAHLPVVAVRGSFKVNFERHL